MERLHYHQLSPEGQPKYTADLRWIRNTGYQADGSKTSLAALLLLTTCAVVPAFQSTPGLSSVCGAATSTRQDKPVPHPTLHLSMSTQGLGIIFHHHPDFPRLSFYYFETPGCSSMVTHVDASKCPPHRCVLPLCESRMFVPSPQVTQMCGVTWPCPACCCSLMGSSPKGRAMNSLHLSTILLGCSPVPRQQVCPHSLLLSLCCRQLLFGDISVSPEQHRLCTVLSLP